MNTEITPQQAREQIAEASIVPAAKVALADLANAREGEVKALGQLDAAIAGQHDWDRCIERIAKLKEEIRLVAHQTGKLREQICILKGWLVKKVGLQSPRTLTRQLDTLRQNEQLLDLSGAASTEKRTALAAELSSAATLKKKHRIDADLPLPE